MSTIIIKFDTNSVLKNGLHITGSPFRTINLAVDFAHEAAESGDIITYEYTKNEVNCPIKFYPQRNILGWAIKKLFFIE
jgi:hypothetical protein